MKLETLLWRWTRFRYETANSVQISDREDIGDALMTASVALRDVAEALLKASKSKKL